MTAQTISIRRAGDKLWLWWGLAGLLGFAGGMAIKTAIEIAADLGGFAAALESIPAPLFGALFGAMLGGCTGLGQWLALRRRLAGVGAWAPATLAAWALFWTLHNSVLPFAHSPWGLVLQGFGHGALAGLTIGAAQWLVLRGRAHALPARRAARVRRHPRSVRPADRQRAGGAVEWDEPAKACRRARGRVVVRRLARV